MRTAISSCAAAVLLSSSSATAAAQPATSHRIVYGAAFFARFAPRTALDMIRETPGFTLEESNQRRGFSGAAGNALIDGHRPIAKSQTLADILGRIPASQVLRIELLRGGEAGGDASEHGVIANVVRTPSAGAGVYQLGSEYAGRTPMPTGSASWSGRLHTTDYSVGANGYSLSRNWPGDRERRVPDGSLTGTVEDKSPRTFYQLGVNGEVSRPMLGGRVRATGQGFISRYHEDSTVATFDAAGAKAEFERNPYTERTRRFEGGVDYDRPLGAWDLTLSGLLTRKRFSSDIRSAHSDASGAVDSIFTQAIARGTGETIVRANLTRVLGTNHRIEAGVEGALNTLDQKLVRTLNFGSGVIPLPVPNSNLSVKELRADGYLLHAWTSGPWTVESRLAAEASRLSFTGDTNQSVDLAYVKPSLQLARRLGERNQLRVRVYRDVGQLDFLDFVSVASITDDRINGGNPDLKPETSWRAEAAADLRFGSEGALGITVFRYWLFDAQDFVRVGPPEAPFDAPGNIGKGSVIGAQLNLRLPLKAILPGASLTIDGTWRRSRVTDPLTAKRRKQSDFEDRTFRTEFRQDLPATKLAWGATYTDKPEKAYYRLFEIERRRESPQLDVWIETTAIDDLKIRLSGLSLLNQPDRRERIFFFPNRAGSVASIERGKHYPGRWLTVSVSGSF